MSKDRLSPIPPEELRLKPIVTPLTADALLAEALTRIEPDNTVIFHRGEPDEYQTTMARLDLQPPDDIAWADEALRIADTLYRNLTTRTFDPEDSLQGVAWYLTAYAHDPSLLAAAISLIQTGETGSPRPPQNAIRGVWKPRVAALRKR